MKKILSSLLLFVLAANASGAATYGNLDFNNGGGLDRGYIKNGNAQINTTGWATYADLAGTAPVDCTGGASTNTFTRSTSSGLRDGKNFLITHSTTNRQGDGASYAFTIDRADQAKPMTLTFDYEVGSGTMADGDQTLWIYDVTNAVMIQPSAYSISNSIGQAPKKVEFQTASNSTSYRLCLHTSSTSTTAYTLKATNFKLSPNTYSTGASVSDWVAYTPTLTGFGTATNISFFSRRVGGDLEIRGRLTSGTPTAVAAQITLPTGLTIDSTQAPTIRVFGNAATTESVARYFVAVGTGGNTYFGIGVHQAGSAGLATPAVNTWINSPDSLSVTASIPILGWGTSQVLSSETDTRVVYAKYQLAGAVSVSTTQQINYATKIKDSHGAVTTGSGWKFTAPVPGTYRVSTAIAVGTSNCTLMLSKGGVVDSILGSASTTAYQGGSQNIDLNAGEYISVYSDAAAQNTLSSTNQTISIERLSGPAQVAAAERVYELWWGNAGGAQTGGVTNVDFNTKLFSSHGAFSGSVFTAPRPGWYDFKGEVITSTATSSNPQLYINGSQTFNLSTDAVVDRKQFSTGYYLRQGDTATLRMTSASTLLNSTLHHWLGITSQEGGPGSGGSPNSIYSGGAGERVERAYITNPAGTAAISTQSGSWLSSVSRTAVGQVTVNFTTGIWSSAPSCVCSASTSAGESCNMGTIPTTTSVVIRTRDGVNADKDTGMSLICMGPK